MGKAKGNIILTIFYLYFVGVSAFYVYTLLKYIYSKVTKKKLSRSINWFAPYQRVCEWCDWNRVVIIAIMSLSFLVGGYVFLQLRVIENHTIGAFWEDYEYVDRYPALLTKQYENGQTDHHVVVDVSRDEYGYSLLSYREYGWKEDRYIDNDATNNDPLNTTYTLLCVDGVHDWELTIESAYPGVPSEWADKSIKKSSTSTQSQKSPTRDPIFSDDGKVWVSHNGGKYHKNANCSNMKDPDEISLEDALVMGKTRCSKCW